ncbi:hypothetical protein CC1G_03502 [Coprinopsis cinerea okayama7|uniref:Uncharacterized protein n=1 Tax=Coprinopsis cinerea (strain Okayama-7 / 130 / ATCC MYA-4618 / FGSC 9003) TaxID=240176 RepID=A8NCE4_COPC7|nr:hypothetical protein CC1G_03502 [Coprinopsis cinerea okayama7\|eukprot:XP_001832488.1 hypothetical protein CC1G_03502 [Coprinopsis cinerea okayama7\
MPLTSSPTSSPIVEASSPRPESPPNQGGMQTHGSWDQGGPLSQGSQPTAQGRQGPTSSSTKAPSLSFANVEQAGSARSSEAGAGRGTATADGSASTSASSALVKRSDPMELVLQEFEPFDSQSLVIQPFEEDALSDEEFHQELTRRILQLMLETHAWCAVKPRAERQAQTEQLERRINEMTEAEHKHEEARRKLMSFVQMMRKAVDALT